MSAEQSVRNTRPLCSTAYGCVTLLTSKWHHLVSFLLLALYYRINCSTRYVWLYSVVVLLEILGPSQYSLDVQLYENAFRKSYLVIEFLQRVVVACYAERCASYSKSVRLFAFIHFIETKWLTLRSCGLHCKIAHDSSICVMNFTVNIEREYRYRGTKWREG